MKIEKNKALSCSLRLDLLGVNGIVRIKNKDFPGPGKIKDMNPIF